MPDGIIIANLENVLESVELLEQRFSKINKADDFVGSPDGVLLLDAVCMRLQVIGEIIKKIHKIDGLLLGRYQDIEWDKIMKLRDIISHHYEKMDHEIVYDICENHIPALKKTIMAMIEKEI